MNIRKLLREALKESEVWYHGTPDVREFEKNNGFGDRFLTIDIVEDVESYYKAQDKLGELRLSDEDGYFKLLDEVGNMRTQFRYPSPVFLSDKSGVASTYADAQRAFDYQGADPKLLKFSVGVGNKITINAHGDRFRFVDVDKVRGGFINSGVSGEEFDAELLKLNFILRDKTKIKTDMIAALGYRFGIDMIDVLGVLDSYNGGSVKSTVRMILNKTLLQRIN